MKTIDRAKSDELRRRLGITEGAGDDLPLATAAELRALRAYLRLTGKQFARRMATSVNSILSWELGHRPCVPKSLRTRELLQTALTYGRELGVLVYVVERPEQKPPKYERPPSDLEYRCSQCGQTLMAWKCRVERDERGTQTIWHARKKCGPVIAGGLQHRVLALAEREASR